MIGGGFLGGGISIVPAGKAIIYASLTTEDGANIPNAVFKAVRTGSTVTANGTIDGRAELLVDAGHTYTVSVTPAGGSYLNNSQTVVTASAKSYAVKFYLYPSKADEAGTTASLNALNTSISTHASNKANPHGVTKAQVGLGNVSNLAPADLGISTATQTALDGKVSKTGDTMTGDVRISKIDSRIYLQSTTNTRGYSGDPSVDRGSMEIYGVDKNNKTIGRLSIYVDRWGGNQSRINLGTYTEDEEGNVVGGSFNFVAHPTAGPYATSPMRESPGATDIINKGYLDTRLSPLAIDSAVVHKTGNESIAGIKSFSDNVEIGTTQVPKQLSIKGNLLIDGNITQNGSAYETHAQQVYTTDDKIIMRDGATGGLIAGDTSGLTFKKYDGTNDGELSVDSSGIARVGDVGDLQPLATRNEAGSMTNNQPVVWDSSSLKMVTRALVAGDIPDLDAGKIISGTIADARIPSGITRDTELTAHTSRTNNPHSVTKAQVGLSNVDNTSDVNKPISTATQTALATKANSSDVQGKLTFDDVPVSGSANPVKSGGIYNALDGKANLTSFTWTYGTGTMTTDIGESEYNYSYSMIGEVVIMRFIISDPSAGQFFVPLPVSVTTASVQCMSLNDDVSLWTDYAGGPTGGIIIFRRQETVSEQGGFHMTVIGHTT